MEWAYGISTTPQRIDDLLPQTLASLERAGFPRPRLFVDGCDRPEIYRHFCLPSTFHEPDAEGQPLGNFGNWWCGLAELYRRNRNADRFVMFEDDIVACRNLRQYLESCELPTGYWNLYTAPRNEQHANGLQHAGWFEACRVRYLDPWTTSVGLGALGLMFDRETAEKILSSHRMASHALDRRVDGAISFALSEHRIFEQCHYPSLLQHKGEVTSMIGQPRHQPSESFPGEEFDCMSLLGVKACVA